MMLDFPLSITYEGIDYPLHDYYHDGTAEYARFARFDETHSLTFEILLTLREGKFEIEIIDPERKPRRLTKRNLTLERVVNTNWTTDE